MWRSSCRDSAKNEVRHSLMQLILSPRNTHTLVQASGNVFVRRGTKLLTLHCRELKIAEDSETTSMLQCSDQWAGYSEMLRLTATHEHGNRLPKCKPGQPGVTASAPPPPPRHLSSHRKMCNLNTVQARRIMGSTTQQAVSSQLCKSKQQ